MLHVLNGHNNNNNNNKRVRRKPLWEVMDMFMALMVVMVLWCILIPKRIKLCTLNMFSFLHVNYTSIKSFKNQRNGSGNEIDSNSVFICNFKTVNYHILFLSFYNLFFNYSWISSLWVILWRYSYLFLIQRQ